MFRNLLVVIGLFCSSLVVAQPLTFKTESFPPFNYLDEGQVAGPSQEIIKAVCKKMKKVCMFELLPWRRALAMAKDGQLNGLFSIGKNPEREEWMHYSLPIVATGYGFFALDKNLKYAQPSDLAGLTVAVYGPSNLSRTLEELTKKVPSIKMVMTLTTESALQQLSASRLNGMKSAVFTNRDVGFLMQKNLELDNIHYIGTFKELFYYVGFPKSSNSKEFVNEFNQTLKDLHTAGEAKSILDGYKMVTPDLS